MVIFKSDGKAILLVFVGAIITIVFLASIANQIQTETTIREVRNTTVTAPVINGSLDLLGRGLFRSISVAPENATGEGKLGGLQLQTGTSSTTGLRTVQLTLNDTNGTLAGTNINVSYEYEPDENI